MYERTPADKPLAQTFDVFQSPNDRVWPRRSATKQRDVSDRHATAPPREHFAQTRAARSLACEMRSSPMPERTGRLTSVVCTAARSTARQRQSRTARIYGSRLAALMIGSNRNAGTRRKPTANHAAMQRQRKSTGALRIAGATPRKFLNSARLRFTTTNASCVGDELR